MEEKEITKKTSSQKEKDIEVKSTTKKTAKSSVKDKECEVLHYNARKHSAIISIDGCGYEIENVKTDPGEKIVVKYSGNPGSSSFEF